MHLLLVHGWGFHAGIWAEMAAHLPGAERTLIDLGFVEGGPQGAADWPADSIAVGHSLGLLWLLQQGQRRFRALVSVQGFDCFCCHIPASRVASMQRGLRSDAPATLESFWQASGAPHFAPPTALKIGRLDEGLDWLLRWDAREMRAKLDCPVLALAARDDVIVPPDMTSAIWPGTDTIWSPGGGHVLPLKHPEWCARHILEFAHALA